MSSGEVGQLLRARHRTELLIAWPAGFAVAGILALAVATAGPPALRNLSTEVSDGVTPYAVGGGGAQITVPAEWIVQREGAESLVIRTPDGALTSRVTADADAHDPGEALTDLRAEHAAAAADPVRTETLASGVRVVHADSGDAVYAAVAGKPDVITVIATTDGDSRAYRAALAQLLEGVAG